MPFLATARETERRARAPHEAAERRLGALQAEARTLAELLDLDRTQRFAPIIDSLEVTPGYEQALVAALGDDLDASFDPDSPAHWGPSGSFDHDLALPYGSEPISKYVRGPASLARRLRQIGVVPAETAASLQQELAAGQRLVTLDGGLWRWDGFHARAGIGTAGSRRLEQRNRVAALVHELKAARATVEKALDLFGAAAQARADAEKAGRRCARAPARSRQGWRRAGPLLRKPSAAPARLRAAVRLCRAPWPASIRHERDAGGTEGGRGGARSLAADWRCGARREELQVRLARDRQAAAEARSEADQAAGRTGRGRRSAELAAERERWAAGSSGRRRGSLNSATAVPSRRGDRAIGRAAAIV
jgi:chromosome segregation protein